MKRFLIRAILYGMPIIIPLVIYICFVNPYLQGDIAALGYITFPKDYGNLETISDNEVVNCKYDYNNFGDSCVLVIGDSFSQTDEKKQSYTYYLAKYTDHKVVNHNVNWWINPFARFLYMSKTKELPKIVVIETVERELVERIMQLDLSMSSDQMISTNLIDTTAEFHSPPKTLLEKTQEWSKRKLKIKGYENPIVELKLSKPCFTCLNKESQLYFYDDDIHNINPSDSVIDIVIKKMDSLFDYASSMDIDLFVLIAADKYDAYQDYIIDNPYAKNNMLDSLFINYENPYLINSKDTLSQMIANDIHDVYWCNDTHWSPIGAEAVAKQVLNRINISE